MQDCGVVYVVSGGDRYAELAFLSAESVKRRFPQLPVTLFTDTPDHPLFRLDAFDAVTAAGGAGRIACMARSPYARTLYLDADTRLVAGGLARLFAALDDHDVALAEDPPDGYARRHLGRSLFNTGVVLYARNESTAAWLTAWAAAARRNAGRAGGGKPLGFLSHAPDAFRRDLTRMEKVAMSEFLSPQVNPLGLRVKILDAAWNYRASRDPGYQRKDVNIRHTASLAAAAEADILSVAHDWALAGRDTAADRLYGYVALRHKDDALPEEWSSPLLRRADLHRRAGQLKKASDFLRAVLERQPDNPYGLLGYAQLDLLSGNAPRALSIAAQAAQAMPQSALAALVHGKALFAAGRGREAMAWLEKAAAAGSADGHYHLGQSWFALEDFAKAAGSFRGALQVSPDHRMAANNLLPTLLAMRRYAEAAEEADRQMGQAWNPRALAFKWVALAELGRGEDALRIADYGRLAKAESLSPPPGYTGMDAFNRALAAALADEPSLVYEPLENTTRRGRQSRSNLARSEVPAIKALNGMILAAVERRIAELSAMDDSHPFIRARPHNFHMNAWTVILDEQGHQAPHIHSSGWLSGVYYVEIPENIRADDPSRQGWLVLGRSDPRWHRAETEVREHMILPVAGRMVTFPSYAWHNTVPLKSSRRRISYAFDIVPE